MLRDNREVCGERASSVESTIGLRDPASAAFEDTLWHFFGRASRLVDQNHGVTSI